MFRRQKYKERNRLPMKALQFFPLVRGCDCQRTCGWLRGAGDDLSFTQIMLERSFFKNNILGEQERDYGVFILKCGTYITPFPAQGSSQESRKNGPEDQKEWSLQPTARAGHDRTLVHMHLQRLHWMHRTCTRLSQPRSRVDEEGLHWRVISSE